MSVGATISASAYTWHSEWLNVLAFASASVSDQVFTSFLAFLQSIY